MSNKCMLTEDDLSSSETKLLMLLRFQLDQLCVIMVFMKMISFLQL